MERLNSKRLAIRMDRTLAIVVEAELVEVEDLTRIWRAPIRAAVEALANNRLSLTIPSPLLLVELQMCNMQLRQFNTRLLNRFTSSNLSVTNFNGRTNNEAIREVVEVDTKAEACTPHVPSSPVPITITKECSSRWVVCTVRINGDPTLIPKIRLTTRQNFASTSSKTPALMKANAALRTDRPNLERSSQCSNNKPILQGHIKIMETKVHTKTMAKMVIKNRPSKFLCKEITFLRAKITTMANNRSSSGNLTMVCYPTNSSRILL
jgi:hypothetical protein